MVRSLQPPHFALIMAPLFDAALPQQPLRKRAASRRQHFSTLRVLRCPGRSRWLPSPQGCCLQSHRHTRLWPCVPPRTLPSNPRPYSAVPGGRPWACRCRWTCRKIPVSFCSRRAQSSLATSILTMTIEIILYRGN